MPTPVTDCDRRKAVAVAALKQRRAELQQKMGEMEQEMQDMQKREEKVDRRIADSKKENVMLRQEHQILQLVSVITRHANGAVLPKENVVAVQSDSANQNSIQNVPVFDMAADDADEDFGDVGGGVDGSSADGWDPSDVVDLDKINILLKSDENGSSQELVSDSGIKSDATTSSAFQFLNQLASSADVIAKSVVVVTKSAFESSQQAIGQTVDEMGATAKRGLHDISNAASAIFNVVETEVNTAVATCRSVMFKSSTNDSSDVAAKTDSTNKNPTSKKIILTSSAGNKFYSTIRRRQRGRWKQRKPPDKKHPNKSNDTTTDDDNVNTDKRPPSKPPPKLPTLLLLSIEPAREADTGGAMIAKDPRPPRKPIPEFSTVQASLLNQSHNDAKVQDTNKNKSRPPRKPIPSGATPIGRC
jgi:hypothetical protein